jgi:hypothetical protein
VTEKEWLDCSEPEEMLFGLGELGASDRKVRLFMCACCRRVWHLFRDKRCQHAVEAAEGLSDGSTSDDEMNEAQEEAETAAEEAEDIDLPHFEKLALVGSTNAASFALSDSVGRPLTSDAKLAAEWTVYALAGSSPLKDPVLEAKRLSDFEAEVRGQCGLLRDIFGNPFAHVTVEPTWLTPAVVKLAQTIYDDQAFNKMAALADALEKAGCDNHDILAHCRGPGPHVRGCWALDLVLGKD